MAARLRRRRATIDHQSRAHSASRLGARRRIRDHPGQDGSRAATANQPHYAGPALASDTTVATTINSAPAGNTQPIRTRARHSAQIPAAGAAMPSTRLPMCAMSESGAATGQDGGQYWMEKPFTSSVHPSPITTALATPPAMPRAPAAMETAHQACMRPISSSTAPTAGSTLPCNGNSPMPKSKRMCSVLTAIAARLSQSHSGRRHD